MNKEQQLYSSSTLTLKCVNLQNKEISRAVYESCDTAKKSTLALEGGYGLNEPKLPASCGDVRLIPVLAKNIFLKNSLPNDNGFNFFKPYNIEEIPKFIEFQECEKNINWSGSHIYPISLSDIEGSNCKKLEYLQIDGPGGKRSDDGAFKVAEICWDGLYFNSFYNTAHSRISTDRKKNELKYYTRTADQKNFNCAIKKVIEKVKSLDKNVITTGKSKELKVIDSEYDSKEKFTLVTWTIQKCLTRNEHKQENIDWDKCPEKNDSTSKLYKNEEIVRIVFPFKVNIANPAGE